MPQVYTSFRNHYFCKAEHEKLKTQKERFLDGCATTKYLFKRMKTQS